MVFLHRGFAKLYWRTVALHAIEVQWLVTMMGMAYVAEDTGHFFFSSFCPCTSVIHMYPSDRSALLSMM